MSGGLPPEAVARLRCLEGRLWVATCPWHPGFPRSAIRSQSGSSTTFPRFRARRPERATSGIAKATRGSRPTKAKTSKLDVLGAKRRKTRRGVKQLTHFRRCGIYPNWPGWRRPKGGLRWVSRKGPNPVGVQECEASSNAYGHAVAQCFHPGDAKSPEPRGMRRSRWPIVSLASNAKPSTVHNRAGAQTGKADQHARKLQKAY